ncbi:acyl-CoA N-acyltransferase [Mycena galericulata]|nr:acyl-CoA N-acyltransferase [Mycena galericulata]
MILTTTLPSRSGRLALVPPNGQDDAAVAALRSHPEIRRYLPFFPDHLSTENARAHRLERAADKTRISFHIHALTAQSDLPPKFVGTAGISHINAEFRTCEMGILISPDSFRGGIATEALYTVLAYAFEEQHFHRAAFRTGVENVGMRGWLHSAGATLETVQRGAWSDGLGGYVDICVYSILEGDWVDTVKPRLEERIDRRGAAPWV